MWQILPKGTTEQMSTGQNLALAAVIILAAIGAVFVLTRP